MSVDPVLPESASQTRLNLLLSEEDTETAPVVKSIQRRLADKIVSFAPLDEIRILLGSGASINEGVTQGLRPLHYAVYGNNIDVVKLLLLRGCKVDARDDVGYTALHLAAERGDAEIIKLLLEHNASLSFYDPDVDGAAVLDYKCDDPLRLAIKNGHFEVASMLLAAGANANTRYFYGPELTLVPITDVLFIKLLLDHRAEPNCYSREGLTPLMKACMKGDQAMATIHLLLRHSAMVNAYALEKQDMRTPLHYAILSGSITVVRYLIRHGAWVNMPDTYTRPSPLDIAVLKDQPNLVRLLLDHGANPNAVHTYIGSPMHLVACSRLTHFLQILQMLLDKGGDVNHAPFFAEGGNVKSPLAEYIRTQDDIDDRVVLLMLANHGQVVLRSPAVDPRGMARNLPKLLRLNRDLYELIIDCSQQIDASAIRRCELPKEEMDRLLDKAVNPVSLQHICRLQIRRRLAPINPDKVRDLPLPATVLQLILFQRTV